MAVGVMQRLEDLNTVLGQTNDHRHRVLAAASKNIKVLSPFQNKWKCSGPSFYCRVLLNPDISALIGPMKKCGSGNHINNICYYFFVIIMPTYDIHKNISIKKHFRKKVPDHHFFQFILQGDDSYFTYVDL